MKKLLLLIAILFLSSSIAYAECFICEKAASDSYGEKATYKIVRGLTNTLFGWTEIFFRPGMEMEEGTHFATAVFTGLGNALARTGNGVVELVTFWNPARKEILGVKDCLICAMQ